MRKIILLISGLLACYSAQTQTWFGPRNIISSGLTVGPAQVCAGDLDGDSDIDIIVQSTSVPNISWHENTDGAGSFGPQKIITPPGFAASLRLADLDGDNDLDLLITDGYRVAWYENLDGAGNFGSKRIIANGLESGMDAFAEDLDGDGDKDVVSASRDNGQVAWYKNLDGLGNFGAKTIISSSMSGVTSVFVTDVDGDNFNDVISCAYWGDFIAWNKNLDGAGTFSDDRIITNQVDGPMCVFAEDMDGDGDHDILSASQVDRKHAWYKNTDGNGIFGKQQILADSVVGANYIIASDLDNDGDMDVIATSMNDDEIVWYENTDGFGNFSNKQIIAGKADFPSSVVAADIDGDSDMDVVASIYNVGMVVWYENLSIVISAQPQSVSVCQDNNAIFSTMASEATDFQWQVNEGDGFADLINNNIYSGTGTDVLLIDSAGITMSGFQYRCRISNQAGSRFTGTATLTVLEAPIPEISGPVEVLEGSVQPYSVMQTIGSTYVFDVTNGNILSTFPDYITVQWGVKGPGQVICTETDTMGCTGIASNLNINVGVLGIEEPDDQIIIVYPNPTFSEIFISSDVRFEKVAVYNTFGAKVFEKEINEHDFSIDLTSLGKGVYLIALRSGERIVNKKVFVQ